MSQGLDIAVVCYFNPANAMAGGAERYAWAEAELLSATRRVVFVSASEPVQGTDVTQLRIGGWTQALYQPPGPRRNPLKLMLLHLLNLFNPVVFLESLRVFRSQRPVVVLTHNLIALSPAVWFSARLAGAKVAHTHQDVWLLCERATMTDAVGRPCNQSDLTCVGCRALRPAKKLLARSVDVEIFPSFWIRRALSRRGPVVPSFSTSVPTDEKPHVWPTKTLAYIGALTPHKLGPLIDAFRIASASIAGLRLVIAGSGPLEQNVRQAIETNPGLEYLGRIDSTRRDELLREAAILVIPSTCTENSPLVYFEALAAGVPVIGSDIGGITELERWGNVVLVRPGDAEGLAAAVVDLLNDESRLAVLRANAFERRHEASSARFVREMEDVLGGLGLGHRDGG